MNPRHRRLLIPGLLIALLVIVVLSSLSRRADGAELPSADVAAARGVVVSRMTDPRITESSGLVVSTADPDIVYTINDSGNAPVVFVVRLSTGAVIGTTAVGGGTPRDIESMAIDPEGTLWVADTGDNENSRKDAALYSMPQPGTGDRSVVARRYPVDYDAGPQNVEALVIDPATGRKLLVSKEVFAGAVFELPDDLSTQGTNTAKGVGDEVAGLITDGAFTADGAQVVLRNYSTAYVYQASSWSLVRDETMPDSKQGETLAMEPSGTSFLVGSEGADSPLVRVPFDEPAVATPTPSATATPSGTPSTPQPVNDGLLPQGNGFAGATWFWAAAVMGLLAVITVAATRRS